jgi:hypothetical protein
VLTQKDIISTSVDVTQKDINSTGVDVGVAG